MKIYLCLEDSLESFIIMFQNFIFCVLKMKPFLITVYNIDELKKDLIFNKTIIHVTISAQCLQVIKESFFKKLSLKQLSNSPDLSPICSTIK